MLLTIARTFAVPLTVLLQPGRSRPGWPMHYRCSVASMRIWFDWIARTSPRRGRVLMDLVTPNPRIEGIRVRHGEVGGIPGRWIESVAPATRTFLYLHGGGYRIGSSRSHLGITASIARAGCRVFAADYRLAPEHRFPAALEDAQACYRGLLDQGAAPERLFVGGDSAGGGLTTALLVAVRDQGLPMAGGAVLISPWIDLTHPGASIEANAPYDYLPHDLLDVVANGYAGGADLRDPRISPAYADLHGLPPLLIQVGGAEVLLDDIERFHQRAVDAGVKAQLAKWDDEVHVWHAFAMYHRPGRAAIAQINEFVAKIAPDPAAARRAGAQV